MKLTHVVVAIPRHPFGSQPDRVLERHGEVSAVAMRLQTAGLDDAIGFEHRSGYSETLLPMASCDLHHFPAAGIQFIEHHRFEP